MNYDYENLLTEIAENEQKVYDAGYEAGREAGGGDTGEFVTREEFQDFETYADENYASKEEMIAVGEHISNYEGKVDENIGRINDLDSQIGDIESALAELHDYSEALKGGEE